MKGEQLRLGYFGRPQRTPDEGLVCLWGAVGALWVQPNADLAAGAAASEAGATRAGREPKRKSD
jgi:hypothetical protein